MIFEKKCAKNAVKLGILLDFQNLQKIAMGLLKPRVLDVEWLLLSYFTSGFEYICIRQNLLFRVHCFPY